MRIQIKSDFQPSVSTSISIPPDNRNVYALAAYQWSLVYNRIQGSGFLDVVDYILDI